jgi:hypothetical protein
MTHSELNKIDLATLIGAVGLEAMHPTLGRVHILEAKGWRRKVSYELKSEVVHDTARDAVFFDVEIDEAWVHALELKTFNFERDFE